MLLQEAIIEKEFIRRRIDIIMEVILEHGDEILGSDLDTLKELYDKYQLFCIAIDRAFHTTELDYEGKKLTIADGVVLKNVLQIKIEDKKKLLLKIENNQKSLIHSNDVDLRKELNDLCTDYKILDMAIQRTSWIVEV